MDQIILGIDIGSSKICSLIAEVKNGAPNIIGMGVQPAKGIKKGLVTNIEEASRSIKESVNDAKRIAQANISEAIVSLSGAHTEPGIYSSSIINIPDNEIGIREINRVMIEACYKAEIPSQHEIIHVLPYQFKLDGEFIDDPLGMSGSILQVFVYIVVAHKSKIENLRKVVKNAGINIVGIVLSAYASSIAVLTNEEKELGVACIDMGASSCDIMIHHGNSMRYDDFLPVGSEHITKDIQAALQIPQVFAEQIKMEHATLFNLTEEELGYSLEAVPTIGRDDTRSVSLEILHSVVFSRVLETLQLIDKTIEVSDLKNSLGAGVVITGGMAYMKGLRELATSVFVNLPVRISGIKDINNPFENLKDPAYATAVGLILYGSGRYTNYELDSNKKLKHNQQNRVQINGAKLNDLDAKEDFTDLAIRGESSDNAAENKADIRLNKGKKEGATDKFVKWLKGLF